jgi:hypothetical protein
VARLVLIAVCVFTAALASPGPADAAEVDLFFAGGQSNAASDWASGIRTELQNASRYDNPRVVHINHGGRSIRKWVDSDGNPRTHYREDLFDSDPAASGALQAAIDDIEARGDTWQFQGLFWWHGESDMPFERDDSYWWGNEFSHSNYGGYYNGMLDTLADDLGLSGRSDIPYVMALIDYSWHADTSHAYYEDLKDFRSIQQQIADAAPNGRAFDTRGFPRQADDQVHVLSSERTDIGQQMAMLVAPEPASLTLLVVSAAPWAIRRSRMRRPAQG